MPRQLVLLRHGQTDWNATGQYQGQVDIPLNATGREQATAAAVRLAELRPTHLFSSDLSRAVQTAAALSSATSLDVTADARLREINVGEWGGLTTADMGRIDPDYLAALQSGRDYRRGVTGETATETGLRVAGCLRELVASVPEAAVPVVTSHGLALRHSIAELLGLSFAHALRLGALHNCAWAILTPLADGGWRLAAYNITAQAALQQQTERGEAAE